MASNAARIIKDDDDDATTVPADQIGNDPSVKALTPPPGPGPIRPSAPEPEESFTPLEVDDSGQPLGATAPAPEPTEEEPALGQEPDGGGDQAQTGARNGTRHYPNTRNRKQAQRQAMQRSEREKENLRREVLALRAELSGVRQQIGAVEPRLQQITDQQHADDLQRLDQSIAATANELKATDRRLAEAVTAGDSAAFTEIMSQRDEIRSRKDRLDAAKQQISQGRPVHRAPPNGGNGFAAPPARQGAPAPAPAPAVQTYIDDFHNRYDWFDPRGGDDDSQLVYLLDQQVAKAGYDPATPDYWNELDRRIRSRLPEYFDDGQAQPQPRTARQAAPVQAAPVRRGPPVAPPSERGNGSRSANEVKITPARKMAMIEANILNSDGTVADQKRFQRVLRQYAEFDSRDGAAR